MASTSGLKNKQLFGSGSGEARDWLLELKESLKKKDWNKIVNSIVKEHPEALTVPLNERKENLLMLAILSAQSEPILQELVNLMSKEELMLVDIWGNTALHIAVFRANAFHARLLAESNPDLLKIENNYSYLPVHLAFSQHRALTINILLEKMEQQLEKDNEGNTNSDLEASVNHQPPSELMQLVKKRDWEKVMGFVRQSPETISVPEHESLLILAICLNYLGIPETYLDLDTIPIVKSHFSKVTTDNQTGNRQLLHTCSYIIFLITVFARIRDALFHMLISLLGMSKIKSLVRMKINQRYAKMLLKECCKLFKTFPEDEKRNIIQDPLFVATKNGIVEIVVEILE